MAGGWALSLPRLAAQAQPAGHGGEMPGGCPEPKAQPCTDPGAGWSVLAILIAGPAAVAAFRRAARRANFQPAVTFAPDPEDDTNKELNP
jgi:hypothetical protein